MADNSWDALVIGGGPGGSTAAGYLARAGKRVLLLEKEVFPRFHIGESLLPYNRRIFHELGLLPKLEKAGLMRKYGAQFHLGNGSKVMKLTFRDGRFSRETETFQVERAAFDHLLLQHARECGAEVREGWTVADFARHGTHMAVQARDPQGQTVGFQAGFLIDASGRANVTGNQEGLREIHPDMRKVAIFGHFRGVPLDAGEKAGDTVIVRLTNKWFWLIPLSPEKVSVGCVMDQEELAQSRQAPAAVFERIWRSSPVMRQRMEGAKPLAKIQTTSDFSYFNRRLASPRLLRVGDAAGFMDPIFSAGVYLAMSSAKLAAQVVLDSIAAGDDGARQAARYHRRVSGAMKLYWRMARQFYTTPFLEIFLSPREKWHLASAVSAVLAGELEGGWSMRWRMELFFWLIRLQRVWPLVPRVRFEDARHSQAGSIGG